MIWIRKLLIASLAASFPIYVCAQRKVTFTASDHLTVTADLYRLNKNDPYIILLHRENSSRGEYRDIAPKLQKLGFNCLAVDLRYGKECNFVRNETVMQAQQKNAATSMLDCEKDIAAAIDYIVKTAVNKRCILLGSSFSASLAMKAANHHRDVTAAIAFSPGEYFGSTVSVKDWFADYDRFLFVATTQHEYPFVTDLLQNIPSSARLTRFQPSSESSVQGAPVLWNEEASSDEYWMSLMLFLNKVKEAEYQ
jgi:dienelactone hydrolase